MKSSTRTCEYCGNTYPAQPYKTRFCSRQCAGKSHKPKIHEIQCSACTKVFLPRTTAQIYCSNECRFLGLKNRVTQTCEACGKTWDVSPSRQRAKHHVYCSPQCRKERSKTPRPDYTPAPNTTCAVCEKPIYVTTQRLQEKNYCSTACTGKSREQRIIINCLQCGKEVWKYPSSIKKAKRHFCSKKCNGRWTSENLVGESSPHFKYGKTTRGSNWHRQKTLVRLRDGLACQICGKKPKVGEKRFDIHHITPYGEFHGDWKQANQISNLITLCRKCHRRVETGKLPCPRPLL
jgi:5-methylcytosine-specific restriction endonuclease McrA